MRVAFRQANHAFVKTPSLGGQVVQIGVIGLGRVSNSHIAAYQLAETAQVARVCDTDIATATAIGSKLKVRADSSYEQLISDPWIDAVAILLPHELHFPVAKAALEAGKHVCLEKPMAVRSEECAHLIELARTSRRNLAVTHNTRFAAAYVEAKKIIDEGRLGRLRSVRVLMAGNETEGFFSTRPKDLWRRQPNGIGALIDGAVHYLYLMKWLYGDISRVQARGRNTLPGVEVEDYALVTGEFANGGWFTIEVDLAAEIPWQERVEFFGSVASLTIDHLLNPPAILYSGSKDRSGTPLGGVPYSPRAWRDASIAAAVDDFLAAIIDGREVAVDLQDAAYAVRLVETCYESIARGGLSVAV